MTKLEFFFDCTSPWTYLAFTGIRQIADQHQVEISWRPILVGGVFNAVNPDLYEQRERAFTEKRYERYMNYTMKDLQDWARLRDIDITWPDFHPANAVKCMRGCFVAEQQGLMVEYSQQVFETYWRDNRDVSSDDVLAGIATRLGMDSADFHAQIAKPEVKDQLRTNTDELIERGGYGSPTIFIDADDMYFGNDRLVLVDKRLAELGAA